MPRFTPKLGESYYYIAGRLGRLRVCLGKHEEGSWAYENDCFERGEEAAKLIAQINELVVNYNAELFPAAS